MENSLFFGGDGTGDQTQGLCTLGKSSITELHPQSLFKVLFWDRIWLSYPGWPRTVIFLLQPPTSDGLQVCTFITGRKVLEKNFKPHWFSFSSDLFAFYFLSPFPFAITEYLRLSELLRIEVQFGSHFRRQKEQKHSTRRELFAASAQGEKRKSQWVCGG